jgi:hypothetical protein
MRHISLEESVSVRACVHDAVTRAVSNLNQPLVTALLHGKSRNTSLASVSE